MAPIPPGRPDGHEHEQDLETRVETKADSIDSPTAPANEVRELLEPAEWRRLRELTGQWERPDRLVLAKLIRGLRD